MHPAGGARVLHCRAGGVPARPSEKPAVRNCPAIESQAVIAGAIRKRHDRWRRSQGAGRDRMESLIVKRMPNPLPQFARSRWRRGLLLGIGTLALTGCGAIHSARMWFPKASGMDEISPQLYVEPSMSAEQRQALQRQIDLGRAAVAAFFGEVTAKPYIVACLTDDCDQRFGSYGQRAAAYGDLAIRLSAKGLTAPLIAHEWSHAEVYRRAGGWRYARQIPRWFDEGIAVVVANEPRHSEDNWRQIQQQGLAVPPLGELQSFSDWGGAVRQYGETEGDVPGNRHVVYTTAGHELRRFLACAGPKGVQAVLDALREGAAFDRAYASAQSGCAQ